MTLTPERAALVARLDGIKPLTSYRENCANAHAAAEEICILSAQIARKDEALRACRQSVSHNADEPRRNVREIVDEALQEPKL
jgi:hypothetical protein